MATSDEWNRISKRDKGKQRSYLGVANEDNVMGISPSRSIFKNFDRTPSPYRCASLQEIEQVQWNVCSLARSPTVRQHRDHCTNKVLDATDYCSDHSSCNPVVNLPLLGITSRLQGIAQLNTWVWTTISLMDEDVQVESWWRTLKMNLASRGSFASIVSIRRIVCRKSRLGHCRAYLGWSPEPIHLSDGSRGMDYAEWLKRRRWRCPDWCRWSDGKFGGWWRRCGR